jgi:hypothetical protein
MVLSFYEEPFGSLSITTPSRDAEVRSTVVVDLVATTTS